MVHRTGKEKLLSFGVYPTVTLADTRARRDRAKTLLAAGVDPSQAKQDATKGAELAAANSFEIIAREWHQKQARSWSTGR
ncbi:MAG: integrase arm-type DNA-binding domain-containing protein [Pseudomonadota bacterium]